jgi:hypothetical protein
MSLQQLAYRTSSEALREQERLLNDLRARTGTLLTATLAPGGLSYVATIAISVYLLAPTPRLVFTIRGSEAFEYFVQEGADLDEAHRTLSYWIDGYHKENKQRIDLLVLLFSGACLAFVPEVVLWSISLALH